MIIANQVITIKRATAHDKYGEPTGHVEYPVKARVVNEVNEFPNVNGKEVATNMTVYIRKKDVPEGIYYSDELSFVDEFGNVLNRKPENIAPARGFSGGSPFVRVYV